MGPNLQNQPLIPNLAAPSSLPINTNELMTMTAKPFNINMTAAPGTTTLFSSPASLLQLGGNSNILDEAMLHNMASPHMSATALLQKAAQMGATVSSNNNSGMAPPSQSYGIMNQHVHINGQHDINLSSQYDFNGMVSSGGTAAGSVVGMSGLEMFNAILDQSKALSRIIAQNSTTARSSNSLHGECDPITSGGGGGSNNVHVNGGNEDVMTLDLLGIGGGGGGAHGGFYGGGDQGRSERDHEDMWRNWSNKNTGFESFSATGSI